MNIELVDLDVKEGDCSFYVYSCRPADTIAIAMSLLHNGHDVCCPLVFKKVRVSRHSARQVTRAFPMLAGYLFVPNVPDSLPRARRVIFGNVPAVVSSTDLLIMKKHLTEMPDLCYNEAVDQTPPIPGEALTPETGEPEPEWRRILKELIHGNQ